MKKQNVIHNYLFPLLIILTVSLIAEQAQAQQDTIWGTGRLRTFDIEYGGHVPFVVMTMTPANILQETPDTVYQYTTNHSGNVNFEVPVYIDTLVGIETHIADEIRVLPNHGSELNILFAKSEKGVFSIFNINGQREKQLAFNTKHLYIPLDKLEAGMYIYEVQTDNGGVFNGKYLKQDVPLRGAIDHAIHENSLSGAKQNNWRVGIKDNYEATYWIKWVVEDYVTDSLLVTIHEGNNGDIDFYLKSETDIYWGNGWFRLHDTVNDAYPNGIDVYMWADSIEMYVPDDIYEYESDGMGRLEYEVPVYIDTVPGDKGLDGLYGANYWVKWVPEQDSFSGWFTDSALVFLHEDENDWFELYIDPVPPLPHNQDISGIVFDGNDSYEPIEGAIVKLEHLNTGEAYYDTTGSDGSFFFADMPVRYGYYDDWQEYYFSAGAVDGKYAMKNFPYTTPYYDPNNDEDWMPSDTINDNFNVVLMDAVGTTTAHHIRDQNLHGTHQDTIWFYLGSSFNATEKNYIRNCFIQFQADENEVYIYAEKFEISDIGINIEKGTPNTQAYAEGFLTPLGNILNPVLYANGTMGTGYYVTFVHEIKRALGFNEVVWYSVMKTPAPDYTLEDKDIARAFSRFYWNAVYWDEKTWIPITYLYDTFE